MKAVGSHCERSEAIPRFMLRVCFVAALLAMTASTHADKVITKDGKVYTGKITSIVQFGFFVEVFGKEGLCHISEISTKRIQDIRDIPFREGDMIEVKVLDINDRGQIKLSHRAILEQREHASR